MSEAEVWLEAEDGGRWPVATTCAIGRSASNDIVLEDGRVSRRHALVHRQGDTEYWVIDLGSGNGTYLNGRRVTLATRIRDRDAIAVGGVGLTFRLAMAPPRSNNLSTRYSQQTLIQVKSLQCWLLVADIKGSTALAQSLDPTDLAVLFGKWMAAAKEVIELQSGAINKFLGDGFLAYWYVDDKGTAGVLATLAQLMHMQRTGKGPPFRLALHQGLVTVGGGGTAGEDSLSGSDIIRVFRMEKLAKSLARDVLVSEEARRTPGFTLPVRDEGSHVLEGFDGAARPFYSLA